MMREFICPRCGLVLEADPVRGLVWMGEHVAICEQTPRATFTAIDAAILAAERESRALRDAYLSTMSRRFGGSVVRQNPPLAFTWAETLSVADAEFLHGLGIDPL